jgi:hypothetical protein
MFRNLPPADFTESALISLGVTIIQGEFDERIKQGVEVDTPLDRTEPEDENPAIPSGYTYLGQFIDHDITFDPMSSLDRFNDPDALQDFRTPRLDLDSVYGSGPDDQPFLYDSDGAHLLLGEDRDFDKQRNARPDLPRNDNLDGHLPLEKRKPRRALIGDKRNDENLIVSQLHTTFLRFHNRVLDGPAGGDFQLAQQITRWHYQWIVLHDFLPRIVGADTYNAVVGGIGATPILRFYDAKGRYAYIPVEFSVAAYRYGHSQVRPSYALNSLVTAPEPKEQPFKDKTAKYHRIPVFSLVLPNEENQGRANLNGFRQLPDFWAVDWAFFFPGVERHDVQSSNLPANPVLPQPGYKIDTTLVDPLVSLPDHQDQPEPRRSLAVLNLLRGWRMGLPSGQSVAHFMGFDALTDAELFDSENAGRKARRQQVFDANQDAFAENCPLWFYILREAEVASGGAHLGPVGGTIVAEVLTGLIMEDRFSFLSQWPKWRPTIKGAEAGHFTMADLINFTG